MTTYSLIHTLVLTSLQSIQAQSQAEANVILSEGVATIQKWQTLYKEHFSKGLDDITTEYSQESQLQANPSLLASLALVRTALYDEINALNTLETYIHLLMPQMEDGALSVVCYSFDLLVSILIISPLHSHSTILLLH